MLHLESEFDYYLFKNIQKYLKPLDLVVTSIELKKKLKTQVNDKTRIYFYPAFPDAVVMFRNAAWKYPVNRIVKIGLTHGAYNFKRFPKSYYYNMFDAYLVTSEADLKRLEAKGVYTAKAIGYPKSDSLLDNSYDKKYLAELNTRLNLDPSKKTLLFSATWDGSGMSAIHKWYNKLASLTNIFNVMVNLHHKMSPYYINYLKAQTDIHYIDQLDIYPYILISDVCISDTSSLIAEFCIADKPIITFSVENTKRTMDDISRLINAVSVSIDEIDKLPQAVEEALIMDIQLSKSRQQVISTLISPLDGQAGLRAAKEISQLIPELKLDP